MSKKKLCDDAKECIKEEVKKEMSKFTSEIINQVTVEVTKNVTKNLTVFLKTNGIKLYQKGKYDTNKQMKKSIICILEGYNDLKAYVENTKKHVPSKKIDRMIRTNQYF